MKQSVWQGEYYSAHSQIQEGWCRRALSSISLKGDESLLDAGCGDGRITAHLSSLVPRGKVLGVDSSASMIAWAKKKYERPPLLLYQVGDVETMGMEQKFDAVFSFCCLHWVKDHRAVFKNFVRALKPNGFFHLLFSAVQDRSFVQLAIDETLSSSQWRKYFQDYGPRTFSYCPKEYEEWALQAKLSSFTLTQIAVEESFKDLSSFIDWMMAWLRPLERLPHSLHRMFADEVGSRYALNPSVCDAQGRIRFFQKLFLMRGNCPEPERSPTNSSRE